MTIVLKGRTIVCLIISIIFTLINYGVSQNDVTCPDVLRNISQTENFCSRVKCLTNIRDNCPEGSVYQENLTLCNCCPGCAKYIVPDMRLLWMRPLPTEDENAIIERCDENRDIKIPEFEEDCTDQICPLIMKKCPPGFVCKAQPDSPNEKILRCQMPMAQRLCDPDDPTNQNLCDYHSPPIDPIVACAYKKYLFKHGLYHWDPVCNEEGFAPIQCKGIPGTYDGECFCVDNQGTRIFGRTWWAQNQNQTCACSRRVNELRRQGHTATLHCDAIGNYEPLQCDTESGTCWCVEPKTGKMDGGVLPQTQWKSLPCYKANLTHPELTDRYLRFCDSKMAGLLKIQKDGILHGTNVVLAPISCDYDGSYAPLQNDGSMMTCTHKNGDGILDFFKGGNNEDMDCNCARSAVYYEAEDRPFAFAGKCEAQTGNYGTFYDFGALSTCVDRDGFKFGSTDVSSNFQCCLINQCVPSLQEECNAKNILPCTTYPYNI